MEVSNYSNWQIIQRILGFAKKFKKALFLVLFLSLLINALGGLNGFILSKIVDTMQSKGTSNEGFVIVLKFICISALLRWLIIYFTGVQSILQVKKVTLVIKNTLSYEALEKFFSFSKGQHLNQNSGIRQSIVSEGITSIQNQIDAFINQLFPNISMFLVSFIITLYANMLVGIVYLLGAILFGLMLGKHHKRTIPGIVEIREQNQENRKMISEFFSFVSLVKNENQEERALKEVAEAQNKQQKLHEETWIPGHKRIKKMQFYVNNIHIFVSFLSVCLFFLVKNLTMGQFLLIFTYGGDIVDSIWQFMRIHRSFIIDKTNIERYIDMLEIKSDIIPAKNPIHPEKFIGDIEFRNVSFYYPTRKNKTGTEEMELDPEPTLKNVSFRIKPGENVGVVGESGSGKTTLSRLFRRSFDIQEGQILIDGHDVRLLDLPWFLQNLGCVDQPVELLDRSIRDNILFGLNGKAKQVTDEDLMKLAKIARIDGFFDKLEHGFDTIVGERGLKLSGGEIQRIGIARALAKDPSILILDEATSALDSNNEKAVHQAVVEEACKGKTAIIIAHRLSTVKNCDRILVLRHGILLAEGTHGHLLENCEYYAELVAQQSMS